MAAVAEMIRAHGEDGVETLRRFLPGVLVTMLEATQNLDQGLGFLAADLAGVAKELLELIEKDADIAVFAEAEAFPDTTERVLAAVQKASDRSSVIDRRLGASVQLLSTRRAIAVARFHKGELPGRRSAVRQGTP